MAARPKPSCVKVMTPSARRSTLQPLPAIETLQCISPPSLECQDWLECVESVMHSKAGLTLVGTMPLSVLENCNCRLPVENADAVNAGEAGEAGGAGAACARHPTATNTSVIPNSLRIPPSLRIKTEMDVCTFRNCAAMRRAAISLWIQTDCRRPQIRRVRWRNVSV